MSYNGWSNRETWLVNLHFGDGFYDHMLDGLENGYDLENDTVDTIAEEYESYVDTIIGYEVEQLGAFLTDYLDLGLINWHELAESVIQDLKDTMEEQR